MNLTKNLTKVSSDPSIAKCHKQIDDLTSESFQHEYTRNFKDISKQHWKPVDNRTSCYNEHCHKQFSSLLERPKHCRSCGEVFCEDCVRYRRRLSPLAQPDPEGEFYKVCKNCFDLGKLSDVQTRSLTPEFLNCRQLSKRSAHAKNLLSPDIDRECKRLIAGFRQSIGNSELNVKLHELKSLVSTPDWMKSSVWLKETLASSCKVCKQKFGMFTKKDFCRLCGASVCQSCSTKDLLLYLSDEDRGQDGCQPQLAIIKIIGCPSKEPEISLYLRICRACQDKMTQKQIETFEEEDNVLIVADFMDSLQKIDRRLKKGEEEVRTQLPKYTTVVESLEDKSRKSGYQNNMKILAKSQTDLADVLAHHVTTVQQLKKLSPASVTQASILKKYIMAKCDFYLNSMSTFRSLKHKLSEVVSPESLQLIQMTIEKNAIISTQVYLRQLIYETLNLSQKYKLDDKIPKLLIKVEESVETDVEASLKAAQEDYDNHMELLKEILQERIKANPLIKVSKSKYSKRGCRYIQDLLNTQVENVLNQILNQLNLASVLRSFTSTKKSLEDLLETLQNGVPEDELDYVFVN